MVSLKKLGINKNNYGSSTGIKWIKALQVAIWKVSHPLMEKQIGSVYQCSIKDYEKVVKNGSKNIYRMAQKNLLHKEVKLLDK